MFATASAIVLYSYPPLSLLLFPRSYFPFIHLYKFDLFQFFSLFSNQTPIIVKIDAKGDEPI